jgi:hypothetical protein
VSDAGDFVDAALRRESSWERATEEQARLGGDLRFYGASVGAVRGTVRDASLRYPDMSHDEITALSSELWLMPVFERRLAAVVLLQSNLRLLRNSDLTRIEGFVRGARLRALVDPLAVDVIGPMIDWFDPVSRARADTVLDRWAHDDDPWLRRAALLSPLRALRAGRGDWPRFTRHASVSNVPGGAGANGGIAAEAVALLLDEVAKSRPELHL